MKYIVKITEELTRHVIVEAENPNEAEILAEDAYNEEKIVLDYRDYCGVSIDYDREAEEDDVGYYMELDNED